ncbi:hypothetical protein [Mycobacterium heckeshornense]|uniref:DNA primase/nucleoside triphosphatase C-terminal domain-containing protein n=1 Tax=Mycobacterium heckeshornense TaxID=110505 RepID=A0A7R7GU74_9MYCO|nr:hypothetical protein [Mycobacterium heckeshornense]BCO36016.1 hypothetical protein MHEC_24490 [Mycobacterium heckeshornense]
MQGLADYQIEGLDEPDEVMVATADYRRKSDHLGRFISECCTTASPVSKVKARALFEAWLAWAAAEGCEAMGRNSFNEAVAKRDGVRLTKSNGERWFQGIALAIETDD